MTTIDHRQLAAENVTKLIALFETQPGGSARDALVRECDALRSAIAAFHMEGIRFRMYNVDRLLAGGGPEVPASAMRLFADVRTELEAAGFHTRSHQAPS